MVLETKGQRLVAAVATARERARQAGELPTRPVPETLPEMEALGFVLLSQSQLPADEDRRAKEFCASFPVKGWYRDYKPWVDVLREYVAALGPRRVMESGCNTGRNLYYLRQAFPELECFGADINAEAVAAGRKEFGLDLVTASEEILERLPADSFDLVFTVSVRDHVPDVGCVCRGLLRCARQAVVRLEVALPVEDKVLRHFDHATGGLLDSAYYFSYFWDYERLVRDLGAASVEGRAVYLHPEQLGPYYKTFLVFKRVPNPPLAETRQEAALCNQGPGAD